MAQPGKDEALLLLKGWFERDLGRYARWDRDVEFVEQLRDGTVRIKIYTDVHCFSISARPGAPHPCDPAKPRDQTVTYSYMGCIAQARKPRAGEDWTRGNDLCDGDLSEETWIGIMGDILSYEMVRVHKDDSASVRPRGGKIVDRSLDETPPTHTSDKPARSTATALEDDASYRRRIIERAEGADAMIAEIADSRILDFLGSRYELPRHGCSAPAASYQTPQEAAENVRGDQRA